MRSPAIRSAPLLVDARSCSVRAPTPKPPLDVDVDGGWFAMAVTETETGLPDTEKESSCQGMPRCSDAGASLSASVSAGAGVAGVEALEGEEERSARGRAKVPAAEAAAHDCRPVSSPTPHCAGASGIVATEA